MNISVAKIGSAPKVELPKESQILRGRTTLNQSVYGYLSVSRLVIAIPNTASVLIGVISAGARPYQGVLALSWTILYYAYSCKINDLADLKTDRLDPARKGPLIDGRLSPERVSYWAITELIILCATAFLSPIAQISKLMIVGLLFLTTYGNAFQKRSRLLHPVVMDGLFGITMASPIIAAALAFGGNINPGLVYLSAAFGLQMVVLNVYSGNFKDLEHDRSVGSRTTSLALGVRRISTSTWEIPRKYKSFIYAIQLSSFGFIILTNLTCDNLAATLIAVSCAGAATVALRERINKQTTGSREFDPGSGPGLTRYVSTPPHLILNTIAFLVSAACSVEAWWIVIAIPFAAILPRVLLQQLRQLRGRYGHTPSK